MTHRPISLFHVTFPINEAEDKHYYVEATSGSDALSIVAETDERLAVAIKITVNKMHGCVLVKI